MRDENTYNALLIQVKLDNIESYNKLYNLFYAPLCVFASRYLSDRTVVEDCIQDVFFNIWKNRKNISVEISARSYLFSATKNKCLNVIQKLKSEQTFEQYILNTYDEYTSDDLYSMEELQQLIDNAIEDLPGKIKTVFCMSRFQHMTYKEIAETQNISVKTVESYMHKALLQLSLRLRDYLPVIMYLLWDKN